MTETLQPRKNDSASRFEIDLGVLQELNCS